MTQRHWPWLAFVAVLACAFFAYLPGLHGGFLFDDFVNLDALGATGRVDDWPTFWRYLTSGSADPIGRPLAMLSFLLDARDWPAAPTPFLRTNVLLHLANALLLFLLLRQLGRWRERPSTAAVVPFGSDNGTHRDESAARATPDGPTKRSDVVAVIGAGLWALHPLFVSTTLYVVQRQAILAATFTLLGLLAWDRGQRLVQTSSRAGAVWMIGGIGLGTLLALLCKANGALLPLLAWVLDSTVYRNDRDSPIGRRLRWLLLVLPSLLLCTYVLSKLAAWSQPLESRPWTIGQRILTEPRVLLDYVQLLIVPRVLSTGVYNDGYLWSTGLLHPPSTVVAVLIIVALVIAGFALRTRSPELAAALLFFFAGHMLESTTIPLELYFEHRNYLPAMLLGWPLARAIVSWRSPALIRAATTTSLIVLLAATTWQRASLWSDQPRMAALWAAINPTSSRAIATQALFDIRARRPDLAMAALLPPWRARPFDLQLALNYVNATCRAQALTPATIAAVDAALRNAKEGDQLVYRWLSDALGAARSGDCPGMGVDTVERWTDAALANPRLASTPGQLQDLHGILGRVSLAHGDAERALEQFRYSLDAWPTPDAAAQQSAWLAAAGHPSDGLALLDHYATLNKQRERSRGLNMQRLHQWVLDRQGYWPLEFAELRRKMREDLAARGMP